MNDIIELLDIRAEIARESERFDIMATVREVFGEDLEVIEFEPYGEDN